MKTLKLVGILMAVAGLVVLALVLAPSAHGQARDGADRALMMLAGRGAEIGVRIADAPTGGVVIEEVQPDSPAEKAGLKPSDMIVEFDGEHVRSAGSSGASCRKRRRGAREGGGHARRKRKDVLITPAEGRGAAFGCDRGRLRNLDDLRELGGLGDRLPPFNFNFDFDVPGALSAGDWA